MCVPPACRGGGQTRVRVLHREAFVRARGGFDGEAWRDQEPAHVHRTGLSPGEMVTYHCWAFVAARTAESLKIT